MVDPTPESSWCEISLPQFSQNLSMALGRLPNDTRLCAVVKANAYGHGIENIVPLLVEQGINHIGIASNSEARAVRDAGFVGDIIRLRASTPQEVKNAIEDGVQELIGSVNGLESLIEFLGKGDLPKLHLSLNANGMSRDGLELSTAGGLKACTRILELASNRIVGLCTHFPSNEPIELAKSIARFQADLSWIFEHSELRRENVLVHGGSTLTLASGQDPKTDMMRCGAILFGIEGQRPDFQTTLTLKSHVISVGKYPKGSTIGYDRTKQLHQDRVLASIALGYSNGYCRRLSDGGEVLIRGQRFSVMGKISMNTLVADVTDLPTVSIGDEVVAFGQQGNQAITSLDIEDASGTIMADLFSDWGQRNPRILG